MMNKERARIDVSAPTELLELDDGPEWTEGSGVVHAGTQITVANVGGTNAFNVVARAEIIGALGSRYANAEKFSLLGVPGTLKAGIDPIKIDVITLLNGKGHIAAVNDGSEVLFS